jgi:hypothetical protein
MKRGYTILIGGAAALVAGIAISAIWGISLASSFISDNTLLHRALGPSESVETTRIVDSLDKPLFLAIGVDQQQTQQNAGFRLKEAVTDPNGKEVSIDEFGESFSTTITPTSAGTYTVTITNLGTETVTIGGTFGHVPFVGSNGQPNIEDMMSVGGLGMIIAGGGLATAGIIALIVGAIVTILDGRNQKGTTASTSEGGITYRKD